jgi:hypothetical protein
MSAFRNRAAFPVDELEKYVGKWVAFDADCTKILASHEDVEELFKLIEHAGLDSQNVCFEGLPEGTIYSALGLESHPTYPASKQA